MDRARKIPDQAHATLQRTAHVRVEHRSHSDDDDVLTRWRDGMPTKPAPVTLGDIDEKISAAFEARRWQHDATVEATGIALGQTRAMLRKEFAADLAEQEQRHHSQMKELRKVLSDLLASTDQLEKSFRLGGAEVINLPSARRA